MNEPVRIRALLVDDDPESLRLLRETLSGEEFEGYEIEWVPCASFEEADARLARERFDLVASDVYRDRRGQPKDLESGDNAVGELVARIRRHGFCPILIFSDGVRDLVLGAWLRGGNAGDRTDFLEHYQETRDYLASIERPIRYVRVDRGFRGEKVYAEFEIDEVGYTIKTTRTKRISEALSSAELLSVLLRTGLPGGSAVDLARDALFHFDGLRGLLEAELPRFCETRGLGETRYAELHAALA